MAQQCSPEWQRLRSRDQRLWIVCSKEPVTFGAVRSNEICCTVNHVLAGKLLADCKRDDLFCNRFHDDVKLNNFTVQRRPGGQRLFDPGIRAARNDHRRLQ